MAAIFVCFAIGQPSDQPVPDVGARPATSFTTVDIFVDAGHHALAAYQVEFRGVIEEGSVKLVGIEGSGQAASPFGSPPAYDPAALANDVAAGGGGRVIIADFSTAAADLLPRGNARVARLHLVVESNTAGAAPVYTVTLIAAGAPDGAHIPATASVIEGKQQ